MDWDKLKTFYSVATLGSLSAAEQILHITQSALSRQISQLEFEMKTKLFERHARGLKLTEAGAALLPIVERIYRELVAIQAKLTEKQDSVEGALTVIVPRAFGTFWLLPHLREFKKRFPFIKLSLISDESMSITHSVREGVYVQVSSFCPDEGSDLASHHICSYSKYFYAGREYLDENGTPERAKDLDHHQLIALNTSSILISMDEMRLNPLLHVGRPPKRPRRHDFLVDDLHSQLVATQNNLGISCLSRYMAHHDPSLVEITLKDVDLKPFTTFEKYLIYPCYLSDFERVRVLKEFIEEKAQEIREWEQETPH